MSVLDKVFVSGEGVISFLTHRWNTHFLLFFLFSSENFCEDVFEKKSMEGTSKRGRSASRSSGGRRPMSVSRSRSRGAPAVTFFPQSRAEETKYFDTSLAQIVSAAADWTGSEVPCTNYIQSDGTTVGAYTDSALIPSAIGAGYGQVVGTKYYLKKLRVKGLVASVVGSDQADVPIPASVRISLVQDLRPNGAQAQGEDVFTDMGDNAQCHFSFLAMGAGNGGRFRVLKDILLVLDPVANGTDGTNTNSVSRSGHNFTLTWKPKKPIQVILKGNSATPTIASLSSQNIFLLAHASNATPTTRITACARAYYLG